MNYIKYGHHISYKNVFKIFLIYLIIFIPILLVRYPDIRNELKYFVVADNLLETKNFFILKYFSELYPDKPPLFFWLLGFLKKYCGNLFMPAAVFLGSVLPSFLITIFSYSLFAKIRDEKSGFFIAISLCTVPFFMGISLVLRMDMLMSFFIFMTLYNFFSLYYNFIPKNLKNILFMYFYIFLGIFTKGPAGIVVPLITIFVFLLLENKLNFLKKIYLGRGIIFILILIGIWQYFILKSPQGKEYLMLILGQETIGRIVKAKTHVKPFYYYFEMIPILLYPYGIFFIGSFIYYIKKIRFYKEWDILEKIGFSWTVVPLLAFSCASGKLDIYLLPLFIGMSIMIYSFIIKSKDSRFGKIIFKISMVMAVLPVFFNKIFNKENDFYKKLLFFPLTIITIFIFLIPFIESYNEKFSLKPIEREITISDKNVIAYRFKDFVNIKGKINKKITLSENTEDLQKEILKGRDVLIIAREKYKNDLKNFSQLKLKYENLNYSVYYFEN